MTKEDILKLRDSAEQTRVQFKERVTSDNKYDVSCEMTALSNSHGGMVVVGINDKTGDINPLSYQEVQETTNLLGSLASEGVVPQILIDTETIAVDGGNLVVARTDIDFIALDKGEITQRKVVDDLITKMEEYANFGFDFMQEKLDENPNYFFKETAFLRVSRISEQG